MDNFIRKGEHAIIVHHSVKRGRRERRARRYEMLSPDAIGDFVPAVVLRYKAPRCRNWEYIYVVPCGYHYLTIEKDGQEVYDSRTEIPCDMELFEELGRLMTVSGYMDSSYDQPDYALRDELYEARKRFEKPKPKPVPRSRKTQPGGNIVDFTARREKRIS